MPALILRLGSAAALLLLGATSLLAQTADPAPSGSRTTITRRAVGPRYTNDKIDAFVDGHPTSANVLGLFKPEEIVMTSPRSANQSMERMTMKIEVKDKSHVMLRYFANKARLYYKGKYYDHNVIPGINSARVDRLKYVADEALGDYVEVILYGEEYVASRPHAFRAPGGKIQYYDVDGTLYSLQEFKALRLKAGGTRTLISGKEAADKYGNPKYATGVMVIKTR
ncbi:hypothetical protein LJY25_09950 [Hymenobacter sp. BT175]|uniref:hypothetical protein n=1 Tax=Hymenobacter translucens TaxID=2886507 RepID=UPI001D0EBDA3|nr:hypothetical protein [Hymenobacter translucens]MCC2546765.1 hypothetical protein [Hymenobacter translucens]